MPYLGIFGQELKKNYCHRDHTFIALKKNIQFFHPSLTIHFPLNFYHFLLDPPLPHLLDVINVWSRIWNSTLQIWLFSKFHGETKMPKFGTKIALFAYFWARILKKDCQIWNQHSQICLFAKSHEIAKMSKFWGKNAWFIYLRTGIWKKAPSNLSKCKKHCHIWNQHAWICLNVKYCEIMKMPKFGTKSALFRYFWVRILKKLLSYLKSAPSN